MDPNAAPPTTMMLLPPSAPAPRPPRARIGVIATAAVLLIATAVAAAHVSVRTASGTATPATGPSTVGGIGDGPVPVSVDSLRGAWYTAALADGTVTPLLARFSPDGTFVLGGIPDPRDTSNDPTISTDWATGDYQARPTGITFHPTGGWCGATDNFAWYVALDTDGRMQAVHLGSTGNDRNKVGRCTVLVGATYDLGRVSPRSPAAATIHTQYRKPDRPVTATDQSTLQGYWLVAGTSLLIHIVGTTYVMDNSGDLGPSALDAGALAVSDHRVELVSGPATHSCQVGTNLTLTDARVADGHLRGNVTGEQCRGLAGPVTLLRLDRSRP